MFNVIIAMTKKGGIGFENKIPWKCVEELQLFKDITNDNVLIVGRKTYESLPLLKNRIIMVLSSNVNKDINNSFTSLSDALTYTSNIYNNKKIFISGGAQLYNNVFSSLRKNINKVYLSVMNGEFECDTFVNFDPLEWTVIKKITYEHNKFTHYELLPIIPDESKYLRLLKDVYENGFIKKGRNGNTKSMFGKTIEFDLTNGYPLITTKAMFFRGIVEELLFFIRGDTDSNILSDKNIKIWNGNTNRQFLDSIGKNNRGIGIMGPLYGYQWRNFNAKYDEENAKPKEKGIDQFKNVINMIINEPESRRIMMTTFNPSQIDQGVLPPCHSIILQFYVQDGFLDMFCFNRSQDLFLGTPFNIASSSLLQIIIAKITGLTARKIILSLGDCHIYESHYDVVEQQFNRIPLSFPKININKELKSMEDIEKLEYNDFDLIDYVSYKTLKADMVS